MTSTPPPISSRPGRVRPPTQETPKPTSCTRNSTPTNPRYVGVTWCDDPISATVKCDQSYIRIKGGARFTYAVICHETGHAVGLLHGRDANPPINDGDDRLGCMHNPPDNGPIELGSNNRDNINKTY